MTLGEKQRLFARLVGEWIVWAYAEGYEITFGEAQRSIAQAVANARSGSGIANSLHLIRLALEVAGEFDEQLGRQSGLRPGIVDRQE